MSFNIEKLKTAVKKHCPVILHPNWMAIALVDIEIKAEVAAMRRKGKTDDEILEVIKPIFEQRMKPLIDL